MLYYTAFGKKLIVFNLKSIKMLVSLSQVCVFVATKIQDRNYFWLLFVIDGDARSYTFLSKMT